MLTQGKCRYCINDKDALLDDFYGSAFAMDIAILLILGLCAACCVIPMFFMGKKDSKKSDRIPDDILNKS